jgi:6-phosphofructokinase 1
VKTIRRLGVLTGGGDAPGLNAVIRAVVKTAARAGVECVGLEDGFEGLRSTARSRVLTLRDVTGIHRLGGTILGTTNLGSPLGKCDGTDESRRQARECADGFRTLALDAVIAIGGDGTLTIAHALGGEGVPVVGVPKTIDNDIVETVVSFGFDSAVAFATDAIDRLHSSADAHHRVMVGEVMGRYTGWIALTAALAGGADIALIPEVPFSYDRIADHIREREAFGARSSIIVAAEGARPAGGERVVAVAAASSREEKLGGIAERVAAQVQALTGREARFDVLGHLQRGGSPTSVDRVLAARFGSFAVETALRGEFDVMVALHPPELVTVPLERVAGRMRTIRPGDDLLRTARSLGLSLGD